MALEAVALRTLDYPYKIWGFGEGMALLGLLRAGNLLRRQEWIDFVADLVAPTLHTAPSPLDHLIPLEILLELKRLRPALDIAEAAQRFVRAAVNGPHRPDLAGLSTQIWVDCLHTDGPGLVLAGHRQAAADAVQLGCDRMQHDGGLFSHGFDVGTGKANAVHWGRGQGWALHGLTAVDSPNTARLLDALAEHEQDGSWHTIVDDPNTPIEHSVSALVASAVPNTPMGQRALRAAVAALDTQGGLPVSSATPVGSYLDRETGVFPWGQGPLLLALLHQAPPPHAPRPSRTPQPATAPDSAKPAPADSAKPAHKATVGEVAPRRATVGEAAPQWAAVGEVLPRGAAPRGAAVGEAAAGEVGAVIMRGGRGER